MKSLYKITETQRELINEIEILDGEVTPEMEQALILTEKDLQQKSIAYLEVIQQKEAFNLLVDTEIKRLQALKKRNSNVVTRLKDNLLLAVKTFGGYEVGLQTFGTRKSTSVEVLDVNSLPNQFKKIKVTESADKVLLKNALKGGAEIEGVALVEKLNLKIN